MPSVGLLVLTIGFLPGAAGAGGDADAEAIASLQGNWTMSSFVVAGETVTDDNVKSGRLVVKGREYRTKLGSNSIFSTITLDPTKTPATIDYTYTEGPQKGTTIKGIYKVEGDSLTVCRGLTEDELRPSKFAAPADSGLLLAVWKRSKPGDDGNPGLVKEELARLQGAWQLVSVLSDGKYSPEDRIREVRVIVTGNTHSVRFGDQLIAHDVRFEIDPTTTPKHTTDTLNDGPDKDKQIKGIYRVEGDTLVSCVAHVDSDRPNEFDAKAGSGHVLRVFRRVKRADGARKGAVEAELSRFEGTWKFASMEVEGRAVPAPADGTGASRLVLKGDRFTSEGGPSPVRGVFEVDPTSVPKRIDVTFLEGGVPGETLLGIYELTGDTYKVSMGMPGKPRPARFPSAPGSGSVLQVLERQRPKP
jgi:uncharacterized protein (TIGR03067 family)